MWYSIYRLNSGVKFALDLNNPIMNRFKDWCYRKNRRVDNLDDLYIAYVGDQIDTVFKAKNIQLISWKENQYGMVLS